MRKKRIAEGRVREERGEGERSWFCMCVLAPVCVRVCEGSVCVCA